jgi:alpha-1,2-mannosyltransferase
MSRRNLTSPPDRAARLLPVVAIVVFATFTGAIIASAGDTLGYDFLAYHQAGQRVLAGEPLYDTSVQVTGGFGLFYYPPPFVLPMLPLALLGAAAATWAWLGLLLAAFLAGVALLPVSATVRWLIVLLAGLSWPFTYAIKLGQVGPILFLLFAIGWRWLDRPDRLGAAAAAGALVKIQPGIVLGWALLTGRWRAVLVGAAVMVAAAAVATLAVGVGAWADYVVLLRQVSDPITTPHNFTPGAISYQLGMPAAAAAVIQVVSTLLVVGAVFVAIRVASAEASYLVVVVASQLLSPVLWDHYAMLLLLPVAYLLARGYAWAALIPLATSVLVVPITPDVAYPVAFAAALVGPLWAGRRRSPRVPVADAVGAQA